MGFFTSITKLFSRSDKGLQPSIQNINTKSKSVENAIRETNDDLLSLRQLENYLWYKGDSDYLMWFYSLVMPQSHKKEFAQGGYRKNYKEYFWCGASLEDGIKRTHSGLPKVMIDTPIKCLGNPIIKCDDGEDTNRIKDIIESNNFLTTFTKQLTMDAVIGDGCYIINHSKKASDQPLIEYIDGRHCKFEYIGDKISKVVIIKDYEIDGKSYQVYEERGTFKDEDGKRKAYIKYTLMQCEVGGFYKELPLDWLEETKNLKNIKFNNIDEMLAVPCMMNMDSETKRGISAFEGKIDQFDDFDQCISQEANIVRAITPVEYIDSNQLEHDEDGQPMKPSIYGKQVIYYQGTENYNAPPQQIHSTFYDIDFGKINNEGIEVMMRCFSGRISPATIGFELARNSSDLSQREKEKITLQTIKELKEYEIPILQKLFSLALRIKDMMVNELAMSKEYNVQVNFKDYANPTLDSKINAFKDALISGAMSVERFVDECYGEESEEFKQKEIEYITNKLNKDTPTFNLGEF